MSTVASRIDALRGCFSVLGCEARSSIRDGSAWQLTPRYMSDAEPVMVRFVDSAGRATIPREMSLQARYGLMHMFGLREGAGPRRMAVPFATTVSAVVAAQAVLAAQFARARGSVVADEIVVNPAAAVLFSQEHHLALAAAGPDTAAFGVGAPPPFVTADGYRVEIETFRPDRWGGFWRQLGVGACDVGRSWRSHAARQWTACCLLPESLFEAVSRHSLSQLEAVAENWGVCAVVLRPGGEEYRLDRPWNLTPGPQKWERPSAVVRGGAPLAGITVVELTHYLQGPYVGRVLGMLGADVIRIEPPEGDPARGIEPVVAGSSVAFQTLHRDKRHITLDLDDPQDKASLRELVAEADVFLHNWSAGQAARAQLDADSLWQINPSLVHTHAGGGGAHLPHTASDWSIQAASGLAHTLRPEGESPAVSQLTLLDPLGGMLGALGTLSALLQRQRDRRGMSVSTSLLHAARTLLTLTPLLAPTPHSEGPAFHPLPTNEGHLALDDSPQLRASLGLSCTAERDEFTAALSGNSAAWWEEHLSRQGVQAARVRGYTDILPDLERTGVINRDSCVHLTAPWRFQ